MKKILVLIIVIIWSISILNCSESTKSKNDDKDMGFLHAQDKMIVEGNGDEIILRGMGFGGWMVQEPYMMQHNVDNDEGDGGQHVMFSDIEELIGKENLETYHQTWLDNYCTEKDVEQLANMGFNSLRVALHYNQFTLPIEDEPFQGQNTWLDRGFEMTDKLLEWCENHEIYLILDLHAAPGGQGKDANISDYDPNKPSLWESPLNQQKTIDLWKKLAERYVDETWIGGYDLINETNWNNPSLKQLFDNIISAIREVDQNHLIFIEGNWFANTHDGLWPFNDDNVALSFHRYWCDNTVDTFIHYLEMRNDLNVPLWMGESGENSNEWYADAVKLLEEYKIGWAWWTWKKIESGSGVYSIKKPDGYDQLKNYWENGGEKPDTTFAFNVMMNVAENAKIEKCQLNVGVIQALIQD